MINTLCNGLNPSQASLQLSLCVDTWDEFGPFTLTPQMHLTELEERRVQSYYCSWEGDGKKDGEEGWVWKGSRAAPALSTLQKHRRAVGWSRCVRSLLCHPHGQLPLRGTCQPKPCDLATLSPATWSCRPQLQKARGCQTSPAAGTGRMGSAAFLICRARLRAAAGR